jgi:hypothetical protein
MTSPSGRQSFDTPGSQAEGRAEGQAEDQAEGQQRLTPEQLLALQLAARGRSLTQIGPLVEQAPEAIPMFLASAIAALGRRTLAGAIFEAKRRGLIA